MSDRPPRKSNLQHRSPGLTVIFNELSNIGNARIMDLGPMRASNFNFFSALKCNIHFENLDEFLFEFGKLSIENLLFRLKSYLLDQHGRRKFNIVLAWDIFNYLPPEALRAVLESLAPYCEQDALLHMLAYTNRNIPDGPQVINIKDQYFLQIEMVSPQPRRLPHLDTSKLLKNSPGYVLQETLSNKDGMQNGITEYLLRYLPTNPNKKRAISKTEMTADSVMEIGSVIHVSPAMQYLKSKKPGLVLDLGQKNIQNGAFFGSTVKDIYNEDISSLLESRLLRGEPGDGTEFGSGLFNFDLRLRFDLVLLWDIPNFLDAKQLNELLVRLRPFLHADTQVLTFLYSRASAAKAPRRFTLLENGIALNESKYNRLSYQPHSAIEFTKCLPGLKVDKTFILQPGMLAGIGEYLMSFH